MAKAIPTIATARTEGQTADVLLAGPLLSLHATTAVTVTATPTDQSAADGLHRMPAAVTIQQVRAAGTRRTSDTVVPEG
jgi:hypothetical protein